jgi:hypothetical protein
MLAVLREADARVVGATTEDCPENGAHITPHPPDWGIPAGTNESSTGCYWLANLAWRTGAVLEGEAALADEITLDWSEVPALVSRVAATARSDVDTVVRADPHPRLDLDARRFVRYHRTACAGEPPSEPCWEAASGALEAPAVRALDATTFFGALPGTQLRFDVAFANDFFRGTDRAEVFIVFVEVRADVRRRIELRPFYIVVPRAELG